MAEWAFYSILSPSLTQPRLLLNKRDTTLGTNWNSRAQPNPEREVRIRAVENTGTIVVIEISVRLSEPAEREEEVKSTLGKSRKSLWFSKFY
jgi:hypothetical protein